MIQYWSRVEKTSTPAALGFEVEVGAVDEEVEEGDAEEDGAADDEVGGTLLDVGGAGTLALVNQTAFQRSYINRDLPWFVLPVVQV